MEDEKFVLKFGQGILTWDLVLCGPTDFTTIRKYKEPPSLTELSTMFDMVKSVIECVNPSAKLENEIGLCTIMHV